MSALGAFTFVLHSHLPYQPDPKRWAHAGKSFYETITETYLPLLHTLHDLKNKEVPFRLTMCLSPLLIEQLAKPAVIAQLKVYLEDRVAAARHDLAYFDPGSGTMPDPHLHYLAGQHLERYEWVQSLLQDSYAENLIEPFKTLHDEGYIELAATAATHAYLPLLGRESAVQAQVKAGLVHYEQVFGRPARVFWLPACGYRPGIEGVLVKAGLQAIFVEPHMITDTPPIGVAAGDVLGPFHDIKQQYLIPRVQPNPNTGLTSIQPYALKSAPELTLISRDDRATMQVWGAIHGYPIDVDYLEQGRHFGLSDLPYWRITGDLVDPHDKDQYHPDWAKYKVEQHAEHFAHMIGDMIREYADSTGQYGFISTHLETELFGHWWSEGVDWLGQVLRHLSHTPQVDLLTVSEYLEGHQAQATVDLAEGSWGTGGGHFIWQNPTSEWIWPLIHDAETRMQSLAAQGAGADADTAFVLAQAARELLLLQSSDWPLMMTLDEDRDYAVQCFNEHLERFTQLADSLDAGTPDRKLADSFWSLAQVFPDMEYGIFDES